MKFGPLRSTLVTKACGGVLAAGIKGATETPDERHEPPISSLVADRASFDFIERLRACSLCTLPASRTVVRSHGVHH